MQGIIPGTVLNNNVHRVRGNSISHYDSSVHWNCYPGDEGVGKSCIAQRFVRRHFNEHSSPTIGGKLEIKSATVEIESVLFYWNMYSVDPVVSNTCSSSALTCPSSSLLLLPNTVSGWQQESEAGYLGYGRPGALPQSCADILPRR